MKLRLLGLVLSGVVLSLHVGCGDDIVETVPGELPDAPVLKKLTPAEGPAKGGTAVVIQGEGFQAGAVVRFGGVQATNVIVVSPTSISLKTPPGVGGAVTVTIENPDHLAGDLEDAFTYKAKVVPPPDGTVCKVASTAPTLGAANVDVVWDLHVKWSHKVDPATLAGNVTLSLVGGADVPVTLEAEGDDGAVVHPGASLRFWGAYQLAVGEGVTADDGTPCDPAAIAFAARVPDLAPRPLKAGAVFGMIVKGDTLVTASRAYRGFQTYALGGASPAEPTAEVLTTQEPARLVLAGDTAYAASGADGVLVLDATTSPPTVVSHFGTPGSAIDVATFSRGAFDYIVVADGSGGARLVDVTDRALPVDLGALPIGAVGAVNAVTVSGDTAYFGTSNYELIVASISQADVPAFTVLSSTSAQGPVTSLTVSGDYLYAALGRLVRSFDVSDPAAPVIVTDVKGLDYVCTLNCGSDMRSTFVDGSDLFVTDNREGALRISLDGAGGMTIAAHYPVASAAHAVALYGSKVVVGADEGVLVFDRETPGTPVVSQGGWGDARSVLVDGGEAYVASDLLGIQTYDIATADAPSFASRVATPASTDRNIGAQSIAPVGTGGLFVSDGRASGATFDLSNPTLPALAGSLQMVDLTHAAVVDGTTAYVCDDSSGLSVIDVGDLAHPTTLGLAAFEKKDSCFAVAKVGAVVYVGSDTSLRVTDVSAPAAPSFTGTAAGLPEGSAVISIAQSGTRLFALLQQTDLDAPHNRTRRLASVDISSPMAPAVTWVSEDLGGGGSLTAMGDLLMVAGSERGVLFYDISDGANPVLEGELATPGVATAVAGGDGVVYVSQSGGGLQAIHTGALPKAQ